FVEDAAYLIRSLARLAQQRLPSQLKDHLLGACRDDGMAVRDQDLSGLCHRFRRMRQHDLPGSEVVDDVWKSHRTRSLDHIDLPPASLTESRHRLHHEPFDSRRGCLPQWRRCMTTALPNVNSLRTVGRHEPPGCSRAESSMTPETDRRPLPRTLLLTLVFAPDGVSTAFILTELADQLHRKG